MKIGAITVGQSPRLDVTEDIKDIFSSDTKIIERGALDGMSLEEVRKLKPKQGDYILVSRMSDGTEVSFSEHFILPRIQQCIEELEKEGVCFILFFCTGEFLHPFVSTVPLIFPNDIMGRLVPVLSGKKPVIVVNPSKSQFEQSKKKWSPYVTCSGFAAASPYGTWEEIEAVCREIKSMEGELVILDCIGYSKKMKAKIVSETGKMVVLSRTLLARTVSELTDIL